ncbi:MAG: type I restriction enzyme, S subunit [Candidatus Methanocomedens sp.]|nr:MAG: type I restriction enzyme, S subunit [ANME-2 cluster archaeon]
MDKYNKSKWIQIAYKEAIDKISTNNKKVKQKDYISEGKYPVIDQGQDFIGGFTNDELKLLDCTLPALVFGDHTKIVKLVNYKFAPGADGVKVIVPRKFFDAKLFEFFTKILALKIPDKGYARHFQHIEKSEIPLPPLPEQRAIVSKIEQLFSDLDNGINNFKKAQEQLKIYRQAVLKNACEGKLVPTEAELARAEGRDYEPADVLLARILEERREKWNGKGKYKVPAAPDTSGLPELPEGWCYTHIATLFSTNRTGIKTGPFGSLLKKHEHRIEGIPVLGIENIKAMKFIAGSKIRITKEKSTQLSGYDALPDDVLISRSGTVGEVCVVPEGLGESRISTNLMRVSLAPNGMLPLFFTFLFNGSPYVLDQVTDLCKGSTRNFLNRGILLSLIFPLPPLAEQRRIVTELERRLSVCDKMESTIAESLEKAESLHQSILKKAFEGKLLNEKELEEARNAPEWEPAEKLLERIKAQKNN